MKKKMSIGIISVLVGLVILFFGYKCYLLYRFTNKNGIPNVVEKQGWNLVRSDVDYDKTFEIGSLKMRNDFEEFELTSDTEYAREYTVIDDETGEKGAVKMFKMASSIEDVFDPKIFGKYFEKNGLDDLNEVVRYVLGKSVEDVNIFSSRDKLIENYIIKYVYQNFLVDGEFIELNGTYNGYVLKASTVTEVKIFERDYEYIMSFSNNKIFTDEYIKELIQTVRIG